MSFTLSTGNKAYPSISAKLSVNSETTAMITVTASCYLSNGYVQSTGIVAKIYINGVLAGTKTVLGNGTRYDAPAVKSVTATDSIDKGKTAKSVPIKVEFWQYVDGKQSGTAAKEIVSSSISVPAKTSYTIAYNANGGSGAPGSQIKWHGENLKISSTKPTKAGYTFKGWALTQTDANNGTWYYQPDSSCGANKTLTLFAVWEAVKYTVSYDANGGSGAPTSQKKTHGTALKLSETKPTRSGYNFKGWATKADATTAVYSAGDEYTTNADVTLFAVWELGYKKPRINNLSVFRCDAQKVASDSGNYVAVQFDWETDSDVTLIYIEDKKQNDSNYYGGAVSGSGKSGRVDVFLKAGGNSDFDPDYTYQIRITITDGNVVNYVAQEENRTTVITRTLNSWGLPIDFKPPTATDNRSGVSIGKTAETNGLFEVDYKTQLNDFLHIRQSAFQAATIERLNSANGVMVAFANSNGILGCIGMSGAINGGLLRYLNDATQTFVVLDTGNYASYCLPLSGGKLTGELGVNTNLYSISNYGLIFGVDNNREIIRLYQAGGVTTGSKWFAPCDGVLIDLGTSNNPWDTAYIRTVDATTVDATTVNASTVDATTVKATNGIIDKVYGSGNYSVKFGVNNNTELAWVYQAGGSTTGSKWFAPATNGGLLLGSSNYKWSQIWASTSTISTSDRNEKKDFAAFDERYEALFKKLKPQTFKFIDGTSGRTHSGFIAQDIEEALAEVGLTALDFAGFCKDVKTEHFENAETGEVTFKEVLDENGNPQHMYSLRYEEFIALNTHMIQKLQTENSELQSKVSSLEERLAKLEKLIETQQKGAEANG